jgi:intein/homing endonuclease
MSQWTNYFRIVTPPTRKHSYDQANTITDGVDTNSAGYATHSSVSWFANLLRGSSSRLARYKQYDAMDIGDITRALDTIAEEISNIDKRTNLPFSIDYQTEENQQLSDGLTTTIRASLRHWSKFHGLTKKNFNIARCMIKYGDCFFRKTSDTAAWEFVHPTRVVGIEMDENGDKVAYHIRPSTFFQSQRMNSSTSQSSESIEISPSAAILHFSLSDDMGESAPFGLSILQSAYRDWQKLIMLEDAAIIYRVVRAPERRVFYIDVGNMMPSRVKAYLEQIKNDIRQKRVPSASNANQTDSSYNPECLALDTKIPLLDGRTLELQEIINEHEQGKINWAYSIDPISGKPVPGIITWAGVTRRNTKRIKLALDNGKQIICTPDHKFPIQGKGFIEAQHITENDSFFPFLRKIKNCKERIWDTSSNDFEFTKNIIREFEKEHSVEIGVNQSVLAERTFEQKSVDCKIVSVEFVEDADVGTLTIDGTEKFHDFHTFALDAGVYTKNSISEDYFFPVTAAGRGSRVETLPGGQTWEIPELDYFLNKVFRALRVPTSYMKGPDAQGAQFNDGKVGIAYIEELRFANYIIRLQAQIEDVLDEQFKTYLKVTGINVDSELFQLRLPEPQNFALYRQAALDADLINSFNSIEQTKFISKRFALKRYLGLTEDDIKLNETLLKQELNIEESDDDNDLRMIYDDSARQPFSPPEPESPDLGNEPEPEQAAEAPPDLPPA